MASLRNMYAYCFKKYLFCGTRIQWWGGGEGEWLECTALVTLQGLVYFLYNKAHVSTPLSAEGDRQTDNAAIFSSSITRLCRSQP